MQRNRHNIRLVLLPVYTALCLLFAHSAAAQHDSMLLVSFNKNVFVKGDSIIFEATLPGYKTIAKTATLQLWIENVKTGRRWKFRYPLINGYISAKLAVDSTLANGVYAFNFLLQKTFFSLNGHAGNVGKKDQFLNYVMISRNRQTIIDAAPLDEQKKFSIRNLLFQDSAFIIFSRPNKKNSDLLVHIEAPLDSAFTPLSTVTKFITIGNVEEMSSIPKTDTTSYSFSPDNTRYKILMPEIVIRSRSNKRLEDFDKENTSGNFSSPDAILLDGITSDEIANAPDFFTYLTIKVGGLRLETDNNSGNRYFTWRGKETDLFLNEIKLDPETPFWINPADIAMIKIFRPGTVLTVDSNGGGAIAIYTKTGEYKVSKNRNYSFYVTGYTGMEAAWK